MLESLPISNKALVVLKVRPPQPLSLEETLKVDPTILGLSIKQIKFLETNLSKQMLRI